MKFAAVIFDMDGLMLDTEPLYRAAWKKAAAEFGYTLTDEVHGRIMGHSTAGAERVVFEEFGAAFPMDEFRARRRKLEAEFQNAPLPKKPGLDELLDLLDSRGLRKAVATSTRREMAIAQLTVNGLIHRFDAVATGDEVQNGKPAPDLFLLAAQRLRVEPASCLVLEDAAPGVLAAHRAGMPVYVVPDLQPPPEEVLQLTSGGYRTLLEVAAALNASSGA